MRVEGKALDATTLFRRLYERYTRRLRENALTPYAANENFRRSLLDFGTPMFNAYDERLRRDVELMLQNLRTKFRYTQEGARQIVLYVLDNRLHEKY